jgi:hypothetical protein
MRQLTALILVIASGASFASARIVHPWNAVHIEADRLTIDARMAAGGEHIEEFRVTAGTRSASVPEQELKKFPGAKLSTIEIEWSCSNSTAPFESQDFIDQCRQLISMRYYDTDRDTHDPEYWPVVTFVFTNGRFLGSDLTEFALPPKA